MKTRIATLVLVSVFFLSAAAIADNPPTTFRSTNNDPGYLGPPLEAPMPLMQRSVHQFTNYIISDEPWEPKNPKRSFVLPLPIMD